MIEILLLSTVAPAVLLGLALAIVWWTPLKGWRHGRLLIIATSALAFATGHVALNGSGVGHWTQSIFFLVPIVAAAAMAEMVSFRAWLAGLTSLAIVISAVFIFSSVQRENTPGLELQLGLMVALAWLPMLTLIASKPVAQISRLGLIASLISLAVALTLAGSALLGQMTGIVVALFSAYFVFALIEPRARPTHTAHFTLVLAAVALLLCSHFLLEIPDRALMMSGFSLMVSLRLDALYARGMQWLVSAVVAMLLLNGVALYLAAQAGGF